MLFSVRRLVADGVRKFSPMFDRILVEKFAAETQSKGGIMIPEKAQGKVLEATVISCGPGARNDDGKPIAMAVKAGDRVMLPEYGGTKVNIDDKDYFLYRETDLIGKWSG